MINISSSN